MMTKKKYSEVTVGQKPVTLIERMEFSPWPKSCVYKKNYFAFPKNISLSGFTSKDRRAQDTLCNFLETLPGVQFNGYEKSWQISFIPCTKKMSVEAYTLETGKAGAVISAASPSGLFYGIQTLIQILGCSWNAELILGSRTAAEPDAVNKKWIPSLFIDDAPQYNLRSFLVDPGRAPFTMPLLKRVIRIMAHLKLNMLHLHAYDDQLCGLRFYKLPLGSENPYALTLESVRTLIEYARGYHITVMPEIESWGHAQSVIYHFPETYGSPGMWGGMSFGIGKVTYDLLKKIYDEIVEILEPSAFLHVGLDEARWAMLHGEKKENHSPTTLVDKIYSLVMSVAKKHKKHVTMHLWADHGGRHLSEKIAGKVVIQPWKYRQSDEAAIIEDLKKYGGDGKTPCMMGAGWSSIHLQGSYEATRIWAAEGMKYPNIIGITNCMWESNDLSGQMAGFYGGAGYSWNPSKPEGTKEDPLREDVRCFLLKRMQHWQAYFPDADPAAVNLDRGEQVFQGRYVYGPHKGKPIAPTVDWKI